MKHDIRHLFRRFVPRGWYQQLRTVANKLAILHCEGPQLLSRLHPLDDSVITLCLHSLAHPFKLRRCASHIDGLVQNVFRCEYDRWLGNFNPHVIVDAGAYIGDLTCHWATRFPAARIFALEPNPLSYEYTQANVAPYGKQVTLIPAGLGAEEGSCSLSGSEMGAYLIKAASTQESNIPVTTVEALLSTYGLPGIDLLKLDIEGSESEVLAGAAAWIDKVTMLVVEFHGAALEKEAIAKLAGFGFHHRRFRSLISFARHF